MTCPPRSWRPRALDAALAVAFAVLDTVVTLAGGSWWPRDPSTLAWTLLAVQALTCLALAFQRRAPLTVITLLTGFTLAVTLLVSPARALVPAHQDNVWAPYATILAAYAPVLGASSPWRAFVAIRRLPASRPPWLALTAVLALTVVAARPWQPSTAVLTIGISRTAIGPLLALYFDARRRLVRAVAAQARADERAGLAGEMHDLVTRHVTLMVMQAGALRVATSDPEVARAAEELRVTGCRALDELRDLVGVLRAGPGSRQLGTPGELVAEFRAAGLPVTLVEVGDPALTSPVVDRTLRRVVQEGLTNVTKHAPGAATTVELRYSPEGVSASVRNAPARRVRDADLVATGSGAGIDGLRRRVDLVGGCLQANPVPGGGFELGARLPAYVPTGAAA